MLAFQATLSPSKSVKNYSHLFRTLEMILVASIVTFAIPAQAAKVEKKEITMPVVTVESTALSNAGEVQGYLAGASRSSTRTDTPLLDTPQSISVVTQEAIKDQHVDSMGDAIRYVPGIAIQQGEGNRDQITIRGNPTTADFFVDGARDDLQYFRDFYNIDRIEVLKGPNALAFVRGGSGGLINRVTKAADGTRVREVIASGGSWDNARIQGDVGEQINEKLAVRFNAMYENSGTFREYGDLERYGLNPVFSYKLSDKTRIETGYERFDDQRFNDRGVPSFQGLPFNTDPSTFFGSPLENYSDSTINSGFATLTHDFSKATSLRNYARYTDNAKFYQNTFPGSAVDGGGNVTLSAYNNATKRVNFTNQTDLTQKFETGSLGHTLLTGMEITRQDSENFRNTGFFNNATTSITVPASNPISFAPITYRQNATDADNQSEVRVYAGYVQDQVEVNKWLELIGGVRLDLFQQAFQNDRNGQTFDREDFLVSPRAGVIFKPMENVSLYGSYSVGYLPSSGDQFSTLTIATDNLKPEKLQNYEIGAKWDVNPALNLAVALYQLNRDNTSANDPNNPGLLIPTGSSRTRGVELSATGKITDKWQVTGGYAYQDAVFTSTTASAASGAKVALVPEHMVALWNKYDFDSKWAAAIGAIYQSSQYAAVDNTVRLPGYTRFDAAVFYNITPDYRLQVNVENLFDQEYSETAHNNNNISPGSPLTVRAALVANF
jgi:catecholate siderophore receptor